MPQRFHAWPKAFFFLMRFAYVMGAHNPDMMPLPQPMTEDVKKEPTSRRRRAARRQRNRAMDQEQGAAAAPQQESSSASGSDAHVGWSVRDETSQRRMWTAAGGGQAAPDDNNGNQGKENNTTGSKVGLPHDASQSASSSAAAASAPVSGNKTSRLQRVTLREHELPMARAPVAEKMASVLAEKIKKAGPSVVCNNKHANAKYNNGI